jgi:hypothetical protein
MAGVQRAKVLAAGKMARWYPQGEGQRKGNVVENANFAQRT